MRWKLVIPKKPACYMYLNYTNIHHLLFNTDTIFIMWNLPVSSWLKELAILSGFLRVWSRCSVPPASKNEVKQSCFQFVEKAFVSNDEVKSRSFSETTEIAVRNCFREFMFCCAKSCRGKVVPYGPGTSFFAESLSNLLKLSTKKLARAHKVPLYHGRI